MGYIEQRKYVNNEFSKAVKGKPIMSLKERSKLLKKLWIQAKRKFP